GGAEGGLDGPLADELVPEAIADFLVAILELGDAREVVRCVLTRHYACSFFSTVLRARRSMASYRNGRPTSMPCRVVAGMPSTFPASACVSPARARQAFNRSGKVMFVSFGHCDREDI